MNEHCFDARILKITRVQLFDLFDLRDGGSRPLFLSNIKRGSELEYGMSDLVGRAVFNSKIKLGGAQEDVKAQSGLGPVNIWKQIVKVLTEAHDRQ